MNASLVWSRYRQTHILRPGHKRKRPRLIESRDAPSISPPPKTVLTHFTFWSASEQRPVVMEFWLPKAAPRPPVFCSYFSSSHWLFRSNLLILRPISHVPIPASKFGTSALSHWNQWKFSATKVLRIRGREQGPIPKSFSPSFADFAEQDFQKTRNVLPSAVTFCQLQRLTLLEASV